MADSRDLLVRILGDDRSLQQAFTRTERRSKQFESRTAKVGAGLTRSFGAAGITIGLGTVIAGANQAVNAASDLNEQISRTEIVMGDSAKAMIEWSETTASSMGISQRAALAAAGTFAGLFQTVGVSQKRAGELSRSLVQLASDLASLQNSSPEEALIALRSGLAGEAEPLRRFNIFLTEVRVQQQALAETGKKTTSALTQQEKTVARYNLIMKDSAVAQGNFALTSGELANQQRIARAEMDNLSASVGQALVPAMQAAVGVMGLFAGSLNDVIGDMGRFKKFLEETKAFDGWNQGVEGAAKSTSGFFETIRDGIPGMEHFLALREDIIGGGTVPPSSAGRRPHGSGGKPAQTAKEIAAAEAQAGQAVVDKITRQAAAQGNLNVQIANSEKRAAHLRELIRVDPTNAKLQKRFTDELVKQNGLRDQQTRQLEQQTALNEKNAAAARATTLAALDLAVTQARLTKSLQDDLVAATARQSTLKRLVALNRDDLDLAQQLVSATQARRDLELEIAENKRKVRISAQFKDLGLTPEGLKPTPSSEALLKRAAGLQEQIKGTIFDTPKTRAELQNIVSFLKKHLDDAGQQVRAAVLGMINQIDGAFDDKKGPLTKTSSLNSKKLLAGLGLSPEEIRELRGRLSNFNSAGVGLAGGNGPNSVTGGVAGSGLVVENHLTISIDGKRIHAFITKEQQKERRRNPKQKRGPNRNR